MIRISEDLNDAINSRKRITQAPHCFYNYPARFSAKFSEKVICEFTRPGDTVLDPFCGGGTSIVESLKNGRRAVGFDINELASFISRSKLTYLSKRDCREILAWLENFGHSTFCGIAEEIWPMHDLEHYLRNVPDEQKFFFEDCSSKIKQLKNARQLRFVRLALLSVGQWAVDCKKDHPSWLDLESEFISRTKRFIELQCDFVREAAASFSARPSDLWKYRRILKRSSVDCHTDKRIPREWLPAKLLITSPPYPGVHILYHRWQVNGSRETPLPYLLANCNDGDGEAYYCLGRRKEPENLQYFDNIIKIFSSAKQMLSSESFVAQLVSFSKPEWQLSRYQECMKLAGFESVEVRIKEKGTFDYLSRDVPSRKFYASSNSQARAGTEYFLMHRLARN